MATLTKHKTLHHDYTIIEEFETGIQLTGAEVKSIKQGQIKLDGAYVTHYKDQLWLKNCYIAPYQQNNQREYDPMRQRRLLMHKSEIFSIMGKAKRDGLTLLVQSLYTTRGLIKTKLVLAKGKKKHDKRQAKKKHDTDRQIQRAMKRAF